MYKAGFSKSQIFFSYTDTVTNAVMPKVRLFGQKNITENEDIEQAFNDYDKKVVEAFQKAAIAAVGEEKAAKVEFIEIKFKFGSSWRYDAVKGTGKLEEGTPVVVEKIEKIEEQAQEDNFSDEEDDNHSEVIPSPNSAGSAYKKRFEERKSKSVKKEKRKNKLNYKALLKLKKVHANDEKESERDTPIDDKGELDQDQLDKNNPFYEGDAVSTNSKEKGLKSQNQNLTSTGQTSGYSSFTLPNKTDLHKSMITSTNKLLESMPSFSLSNEQNFTPGPGIPSDRAILADLVPFYAKLGLEFPNSGSVKLPILGSSMKVEVCWDLEMKSGLKLAS